jgi:hypothetical protein
VVEAMSHGAVPLIYADGGPTEFVDSENGCLWSTPTELIEQTVVLVDDPMIRAARARASVESSKQFSTENFRRNVRTMFEGFS